MWITGTINPIIFYYTTQMCIFQEKLLIFREFFVFFRKIHKIQQKSGCFVELEIDSFLQMKAVSDLIYPMYGINKST